MLYINADEEIKKNNNNIKKLLTDVEEVNPREFTHDDTNISYYFFKKLANAMGHNILLYNQLNEIENLDERLEIFGIPPPALGPTSRDVEIHLLPEGGGHYEFSYGSEHKDNEHNAYYTGKKDGRYLPIQKPQRSLLFDQTNIVGKDNQTNAIKKIVQEQYQEVLKEKIAPSPIVSKYTEERNFPPVSEEKALCFKILKDISEEIEQKIQEKENILTTSKYNKLPKEITNDYEVDLAKTTEKKLKIKNILEELKTKDLPTLLKDANNSVNELNTTLETARTEGFPDFILQDYKSNLNNAITERTLLEEISTKIHDAEQKKQPKPKH